jgi:hypothetical protein
MSIRRPVGSPTQHDDDSTTGTDLVGGGSRRQFVRKLGLGGAAVAGAVAVPGAVFASAASAQSSETEVELSAADTQIVVALEALETAAAEAYKTALAITSLLPPTQQLFAGYQRHHSAHVAKLATARGVKDGSDEAPTPADTAVSTEVINEITSARNDDDIPAQERALYEAMYALESNLAATFLVATGVVEASSVTAALVGIGPVDGQQAFSLGTTLGMDIDEIMPETQPTAGAYPLPSA